MGRGVVGFKVDELVEDCRKIIVEKKVIMLKHIV